MFYVAEVRINKSGYDRNGQYWGTGQKLFTYRYDGPNQNMEIASERSPRYLRANDRNDAKNQIRSYFKSLFVDHIVFAR